ncbi:MAG: zinc metallopeptidase [Flavobacteriales bacterium]|nr:zinc metallopeptidase [Flavobacteriales bacterium]
MGAFYLIGIVFAVVGWLVQSRLKSKFQHYSKITLLNNMSGKEVAEKMLQDHGIYDVKIISVDGQLSDHYNPVNKTVNLSRDVYHGRSAAAAAVAAHECGHAVQHQVAYPMLGFRSAMVPIVNLAGTVFMWILMAGIFLMSRFPGLLLIAIIAQAAITLFALITLPVEFDASKRALQWLTSSGTLAMKEQEAAKDALWWAAMTYVVTALAAITQLVYLISRYSGRRN